MISIDYLSFLFPEYNKKDLLKSLIPTKISIKSITNHRITCYGTIKLVFKLPNFDICKSEEFHVTDNISGTSPMIINANTLKSFSLLIDIDSNPPKLLSKINNQHIDVMYLTDTQRNYCYSDRVILEPKQTKLVYFKVPAVSHYLPGTNLLNNQDQVPYFEHKNIKIIPSISTLTLENNCFVVKSYVQNLNFKPFDGIIKGSVQPTDDFNFKNLTDDHGNIIDIINDFKINNIQIHNECRPNFPAEYSTKAICFHSQINSVNNTEYHAFSMNVNFPKHSEKLSNPNCINNDVKTPGISLTEERLQIVETPVPKNDLPKYYDPKQTIQLGFQDCIITPNDLMPKGIDMPETLLATAKDIVLEENFEKPVWPYVKELFINNYPEIVSLHSLDRGNISQTVGFYTIRLRDNVDLPKMRKVYYENSANSSLLKEVLEFLCKTNVISKASVEGGDLPSFSSPCFLVPRKDKRNQSARLVVDFRAINELIKIEPIAISNFDMLLNTMRDAVLFSSLDLKSAFQSIELDENSKKFTQFSNMYGTFYFNTLSTGMATSPTALSRFCDVMIHHVPKYVQGKLSYNKNGLPIMEPNKLDNVLIYYDDILVFTHPCETYEETLKNHFKLVKIVISRLAYHHAKLDMTKAHLAKAQINFLGWLIGNSFCQADPKRIEKIVEMPFPKSVTGMRSFMGSLNFLRNALNFQVIRHLHHLTPLTSSKLTKYEPTTLQLEKFEEIKLSLTKGPLFSKIILKGVPKILLTDSASEQYSQFGCILGQIVPAKRPVKCVPPELNLDDEAHRIIYDFKLPVKPLGPILSNTDQKLYFENLKLSLPPEHLYLQDETLGYNDFVSNSLGITIETMLKVYNSSTVYKALCLEVATYIKEHIAFHQILDYDFGGDKTKMKNYIENIKKGELYIDKNLHIIHSLAVILQRTITVVNTTEIQNYKKLISYNSDKQKVPFFLLLYRKKDILITRPSVVDKHSSYNLKQHAGSFEIVLYFSKSIPTQLQNQHIMNLELFALVESLKTVEKTISHDEVIACVDNKCLYYAFHSKVVSSRKNVSNWGPTLGLNFPNLTLAFIKTNQNPSDFLTRIFQISKPTIKSTKLPYFVNPLLDENMPPEPVISLNEWIAWVKSNPQYLTQGENNKNNIMISTINPEYCNLRDIITKSNKIYNSKLPINDRLLRMAYGDNFNKKIQYPSKLKLNSEIDTEINLLDVLSSKNTNQNTYPTSPVLIAAIKGDILKDKITNVTLTTEKPQGKALGSAISNNIAFKNASIVFDPIKTLENLLTSENLVLHQQKQFSEIYEKCSTSFDKKYNIKNTQYSIINGLLYIKQKDSCIKLYLPDVLVNKYVALSHLICNHGGPKKMILNLINYYNENLQKLCYTFCNICLGCLLVNHPTRSQKLGVFPLDSDIGEILHMDLIESLNISSGFTHILVVKCVISNFALLFPMYQKTSNEFLHIFVNSIYPIFHPKAIYTDNGSLFVSKKSLRTISIMGTCIIYSSAFSGASHGGIESYVKLFKRIFKKILTSEKTFNWTLLPSMISHIHNNSKHSITGFSPYEMVFGTNNHLSSSFLDNQLPKLHPSIKNEKEGLLKLHKNLQTILHDARNSLTKSRDLRLKQKNTNKINKPFQLKDIVLVKDYSKILGVSQPLKPYYMKSPYIVVYIRPKSLILKRLTDHLIICRSKNDVKKYNPFDENFKDLPEIVKKVCEQENFNLSSEDLEKLLDIDSFEFENFANDEKTNNESLEFLNTFENLPPDAEITDLELENDLLNDDSIPYRITRQNKPSILKQMRDDFTLDKQKKSIKFFIPEETLT